LSCAAFYGIRIFGDTYELLYVFEDDVHLLVAKVTGISQRVKGKRMKMSLPQEGLPCFN